VSEPHLIVLMCEPHLIVLTCEPHTVHSQVVSIDRSVTDVLTSMYVRLTLDRKLFGHAI